jgi:hypothetical protein
VVVCGEYCQVQLHNEHADDDEDICECVACIIHNAGRAVSHLKMRHLLILAFSDPNFAKANDLLPGDLLMSHL